MTPPFWCAHHEPAHSARGRAALREAGHTRVVATGRGEIGQKIVEVARQHGVPIEENPGLAEALSKVEIGNEIPVELYRAVAEVLTFILRTSGKLGPR